MTETRRRARYRSRTDIVANILRAVDDIAGSTKRTLQYKNMLSWKQITIYTDVLTTHGLMECKDNDCSDKRFFITLKGKSFIKMHKEIDELLGSSPVASLIQKIVK